MTQKVGRLHKAFLRYHDPDNWVMIRAALKRMGRTDLIGNGKEHLIPEFNSRLEKRGKSDGKTDAKQGNDFHHRIKAKSNVKTQVKAKGKVKSAGWAKSKPKNNKAKSSKAGKGRLGR